MKASAFVALAALAIAASQTTTAQAAPQSRADGPQQCFFARNVNNYRAVNDSEVLLRVGVNDFWKAELFAPCPEVKFSEGVVLRQTGGGTGQICGPLDAEFVARSPTGPRNCALNSLHHLDAAEVAALGKNKP